MEFAFLILLGNILIFLGSFVTVLLLIISKIYFNKKFSNKVFYPLLIIFMIIFVFILCTDFLYGSIYDNSTVLLGLSWFEKFKFLTMFNLVPACFYFIKCFVYILPVIFISSLLYFFKTKNKEVIKKFCITFLILLPFIYVSYPLIIENELYSRKTTAEQYKFIEKHAILPAIKVYAAQQLAMDIYMEYFSHTGNLYYQGKISDISAEEQKRLLDEFVKYKTIELDNVVFYDKTFLSNLIRAKRFDDAKNFIEKFEKKINNPIPERIDLYIAQKEYQKALGVIEKVQYYNDEKLKELHYFNLYLGMKDYDKAEEYLNKYADKTSNAFILSKRMYLLYQKGDIKGAKQIFEKIKPANNNISFEKYIHYLDKTQYFKE